MRTTKVAQLFAGLAIGALATAGYAQSSTLRCFADGSNATCTLLGDTATLTVQTGGYAGVYINSRPNSAKGLATRVFSFTASGDTGGGAPRFSIPINTSGGNTVDAYAFTDVNGCRNGATGPVSNFTVSTSEPACRENYAGQDYANWAELAAAFPEARVAPGAIPFIISDVPGTYTITNIDLR